MPSSEELQRRLDAVLTQARENEHKQQMFQNMELKLLSKEKLIEVCSVIVNDYRNAFKVDSVNLLLIDSGDRLNKIMDEQGPISPSVRDHVLLISDFQTLNNLGKLPNTPILGAFEREKHKVFFSEAAAFTLKSIAILPIYRHGLLLGFLSFGSSDASRYQANMATDFLQRLSLIVAISIENVVNIEYLRQLGLVDPLTSVFNRRYFFQRLDEEVMRALRQGHKLACLYLDLDHFKSVNDRYGHAAGDMALMHVTKIMQTGIRTSDILARIGGEEFAILLPEVTEQAMQEIATRLNTTIAEQSCELTTDSKIALTVSIGMAVFDGDALVGEVKDMGEMLVHAADQALYLAKAAGRNCVKRGALAAVSSS